MSHYDLILKFLDEFLQTEPKRTKLSNNRLSTAYKELIIKSKPMSFIEM